MPLKFWRRLSLMAPQVKPVRALKHLQNWTRRWIKISLWYIEFIKLRTQDPIVCEKESYWVSNVTVWSKKDEENYAQSSTVPVESNWIEAEREMLVRVSFLKKENQKLASRCCSLKWFKKEKNALVYVQLGVERAKNRLLKAYDNRLYPVDPSVAVSARMMLSTRAMREERG